jgi:hypothetical protein
MLLFQIFYILGHSYQTAAVGRNWIDGTLEIVAEVCVLKD